MYILRPAKPDDLEAFFRLIHKSGTGITTLPNSSTSAEKRLHDSLLAFTTKTTKPIGLSYLFLLEDLESKTIGACCGIHDNVSHFDVYTYKIETLSLHQEFTKSIATTKTLHFVSGYSHASEICSLYLTPDWRQKGLGKLLSLSRFLFMANHPERFEQNVIAAMRGPIDAQGENPFWNAVCRKFLDIPYAEFALLVQENSKLLLDIIPKYPLYISMLPKEAQNSIGKVHSNTAPALNMLMDQGFSFTDHIDPGDGGPLITAETQNIKTIKSSQTFIVKILTDAPIESSRYIISNVKIEFRACIGEVSIDNSTATIHKNVAEALNLTIGDTIRIIEI